MNCVRILFVRSASSLDDFTRPRSSYYAVATNLWGKMDAATIAAFEARALDSEKRLEAIEAKLSSGKSDERH